MKAIGLAVLVAVAAFPFRSAAQQNLPAALLARELFAKCTNPIRAFEAETCTIYLSAFTHGVIVAQGNSQKGLICFPPNFTGNEAREVFIRMMRNNPHWLDARVDEAVGAAFAAEFPCPELN